MLSPPVITAIIPTPRAFLNRYNPANFCEQKCILPIETVILVGKICECYSSKIIFLVAYYLHNKAESYNKEIVYLFLYLFDSL